MKQLRWFKEQLLECGMQTKWMRFVILWFLPLCIVTPIPSLIRNVVQHTTLFQTIGHIQWVFVLLDVWGMAVVMLAALAFWFSIQLIRKGYRLIIVLFIIQIVGRAAQSIVFGYWKDGIIILLVGILFWIANIDYFSKRKQLFGLGKPLSECKQPAQAIKMVGASAMDVREKCREVLSDKRLPAGWLRFYILWFLPIYIGLNIAVLVFLIATSNPFYNRLTLWQSVSFFAFTIVQQAFLYATYRRAVRLQPVGYRMLILVNIFELAARTIWVVFLFLTRGAVIATSTCLLLALIALYNLFHFNNCKSAFYSGFAMGNNIKESAYARSVRLFKERLNESEIPTKWMQVFILWGLPVSITVGGLGMIACVVRLTIDLRTFGLAACIDAAFFVYCCAIVVLSAFALGNSVRLLRKGYRLILAIFIVHLASLFALFVVFGYFKMDHASQLSILIGFFISIANLMYCVKRKQLFAGQGEKFLNGD